jgi:hypothetical protein
MTWMPAGPDAAKRGALNGVPFAVPRQPGRAARLAPGPRGCNQQPLNDRYIRC